MSDNFNNGWQMAVDWIIELTESRHLEFGFNPKGGQVQNKMRVLPKGYDAGFGEGLTYAIGTPISELLKNKSK